MGSFSTYFHRATATIQVCTAADVAQAVTVHLGDLHLEAVAAGEALAAAPLEAVVLLGAGKQNIWRNTQNGLARASGSHSQEAQLGP